MDIKRDKIIPVYLEEEIKDSYLDYSMSVIVARALPDVRDGLKPVHRRVQCKETISQNMHRLASYTWISQQFKNV